MVCAVGASLVFGLVRRAGAFAAVLPSFALVSRMPFAQDNHDFDHYFTATSSSRREATVVGTLTRVSTFRVGLVVGGATIVSGSYAFPSHLWISHLLTSSSSLFLVCFVVQPSVCEACFLNSSF